MESGLKNGLGCKKSPYITKPNGGNCGPLTDACQSACRPADPSQPGPALARNPPSAGPGLTNTAMLLGWPGRRHPPAEATVDRHGGGSRRHPHVRPHHGSHALVTGTCHVLPSWPYGSHAPGISPSWTAI